MTIFTMTIFVMISAALLSAASLFWVLGPARHLRFFTPALFACAALVIGVYLAEGRPDLPPAPVQMGKGAEADYRALLADEFRLVAALSDNPEDADAMIRLAAIRLAQGRAGDETMRLLAKARTITPDDARLVRILKALEKPD